MNTFSRSPCSLYSYVSAIIKGLDKSKTIYTQCWSFGPHFYHEECLSLKLDH